MFCSLTSSLMKKTELILPEEIYRVAWDSIRSRIKKLRYARVFMPLSSLLEGEFFNTYIKTGILTPSFCFYCSEFLLFFSPLFSFFNIVMSLFFLPSFFFFWISC